MAVSPAAFALSIRFWSRATEPTSVTGPLSRARARSIRASILGTRLHRARAPSPVGALRKAGALCVFGVADGPADGVADGLAVSAAAVPAAVSRAVSAAAAATAVRVV